MVRGIRVVDDYGHHPTELRTVFQTAREQPHQRVVAVFQPHRFTRTAQFLDGFAQVLASADVDVLADNFPAGELPITGVSAVRSSSIQTSVRWHLGEMARAWTRSMSVVA